MHFEPETEGGPGGEGEKTLTGGPLPAIYNVVIDLAKVLVLRKNVTREMTSCNGHGMVCKLRVEEARPFHWSHDSGSI
jgi:hypothetical protein